MASFVAEVLSSAGQMEREEIHGQLAALVKKIDEIKMEIHHATTEKYVDFFPSLMASEDLAERVRTASSDMKLLADKIETEIKGQLSVSTGEFQTLTRQLEEVSAVMKVLDKLVGIQDALDKITESVHNKKYVEAAHALKLVQNLLAKPAHCRENEMHIIQALHTECKVQREKLIYELSDVWKEHVVWGGPEDAGKVRKFGLKIVWDGEGLQVMKEVVLALEMLQNLHAKIKTFGEKFVSFLVQPIVAYSKVEIESQSSGRNRSISISVDPSSKGASLYQHAFVNLDQVFAFVHENLLSIPSEAPSGESDVARLTLMEILGKEVADRVLDIIVKNCLSNAIPSNSKDLEKFHEVVSLTGTFQQKLLALKFLPKENRVLLDYVENINVLFANKKCQEILQHARKLMTSEIHDTVLISDDKPLGELPSLPNPGSGKKMKRTEMGSQIELSSNTFKMPTCRISASVQKLMCLAYDTLHDAVESTPQCAVQLFYAVRNIFELFCCVFPTYHRQNLATLPQAAALHHTNCMFITHHLMTMGHQFSHKLTSVHATFVDQISAIRQSGTEIFLSQMAAQKKQLLELLDGAQGFINISEEERYFAAERAIKQTLHQLNHLHNIWQEILPINVYRKSIGMLVNVMVTHLVDCITSLEDITSDSGRQLHNMLSVVTEKSGSLFNTETDVASRPEVELQKNVPKWQKFKETHLVLNASLQEIDDRWADGKGPLAVEFSPNELKQLVRALFQNTDRRAAVLTKIH